MKDRMMNLKEKSGRVLARVEMTKNRMFKLNLKIKTLPLGRKGKLRMQKKFLKYPKH